MGCYRRRPPHHRVETHTVSGLYRGWYRAYANNRTYRCGGSVGLAAESILTASAPYFPFKLIALLMCNQYL